MSKVTVTESYLEDIGDAIRGKLGTSQGYTPGQMAAAINSIPTGGITPTGTISITQNGTTDVTQYASAAVNVPNNYTQADEGKVVQNGALVAQTSETVTQNGTYDTTTKDEVVVDVQGGTPNLQDKTFTQNGTYTADAGYDGFDEVTVNVSGGGGANILSGTTEPTAAQGSNGDIYLVYSDGTGGNLLSDYQNIALWTKNKAAFTRHEVTYADGVSTLVHQGGNGYERIFVPVSVQQNSDYIYSLDFRAATNIPSGYGGALAIAVTPDDQTNTGSSGSYTTLGNKVDLSRTQTDAFSNYVVQFNSGNHNIVYVVIDLNITDGSTNTLVFKNIKLERQSITPGTILSSKLKVSGTWQNLEGSNIEDVTL